MVLVIGGIASGKRTYVRSLGFSDDQMDASIISDAPVLVGLEGLLRTGDLDEQQMEAIARKDVVACCEVGMGVVPLDRDERTWRERVGRTCTELAARSERVIRLVCGIPVTIKG